MGYSPPPNPERVRVEITVAGHTHIYDLVHDDRQHIEVTVETETNVDFDPTGKPTSGPTRASIQISGLLSPAKADR